MDILVYSFNPSICVPHECSGVLDHPLRHITRGAEQLQ